MSESDPESRRNRAEEQAVRHRDIGKVLRAAPHAAAVGIHCAVAVYMYIYILIYIYIYVCMYKYYHYIYI